MESCFERVNDLTTGQQAALRRSAGKSLNEVDASALQAFFSAVSLEKPYNQEKAFTVACIMCLWKPEERVSPKPFAKCLCALRTAKKNDSNGLDARFRNLIDTVWSDDDGYLAVKLVRLCKMLKNSGAGYPDPEALYQDLKNWDHPDRFVQRRWMEQYLNSEETNNDNNSQEEE